MNGFRETSRWVSLETVLIVRRTVEEVLACHRRHLLTVEFRFIRPESEAIKDVLCNR